MTPPAAASDWARDGLGKRLVRIVTDTRTALAALPEDAGVTATVNTVGPILGAYWPDRPDAAAAAAAAQLRTAAMHRPPGFTELLDFP